METYFLDKTDKVSIFKIAKTILLEQEIITEKSSKKKIRDEVAKLLGYSGDTLYNQFENDPNPWISKKALGQFLLSLERFEIWTRKNKISSNVKALSILNDWLTLSKRISQKKRTVIRKKTKQPARSASLPTTDKLKRLENTKWYIFFYEEQIKTEKKKTIVYEGVSWAILGCHSGEAELKKQKSPNDEKATSLYTGKYSLVRESKDLQLELKLGTVRDLRITLYLGDTNYFDVCVGMATNVTETFEAWTVLMVAAEQIESSELKPGFRSQQLETKESFDIPDYIWSFFEKKSTVYLVAPKTGTGIREILAISKDRK